MDQNTGENSQAYQAKRDINITNTGMDYSSVKQLCLDIIHDNFPKLQDDAMEQVNQNVLALAEELKGEIEKRKESLSFDKLASPDVQAALNDALQGAARKGKKADLNLLASLVASRIDNGNSELLEITIEEAIKIVPKLTKSHINFLVIKHFISSMNLNIPNIMPQHIEQLAITIASSFFMGSEITEGHIRYLAGLGLLDYNPMFGHDIWENKYNAYESLASDKDGFKTLITNTAPTMAKLINSYDKNKFAGANLTAFGQVIALTSINRIIGNIDLKIWIK